jgi:hypothetical protein
MSLEMAQKVIVPQKKNYVPQFLKQRDINSYFIPQVPYLKRLYAIKLIKIEEMKNLTLGHL